MARFICMEFNIAELKAGKQLPKHALIFGKQNV